MGIWTVHGNGGVQNIATAIVTMIVTSCFASIRICTRACIKQNWNSGDWLFILSQIFYLGVGAGVFVGASAGNKPLGTITVHDLSAVLQWWFICEILYSVCVALLRASIGLLLIGICEGIERRYSYIIYATIGFYTINTFITVVYVIAQCHPVSFYWRQVYGVPGHCVDPKTFGDLTTFTASLGAFTDLILAVLPNFFLWKLRMDFRSKVSVHILLSLGLGTTIVAVIRAVVISRTIFTVNDAFFIHATNVGTLSMVEPAVGICCAAASTFRPLFRNWEQRSQLVSAEADQREGFRMRHWYKGGYRRNVSEPEDVAIVTRA